METFVGNGYNVELDDNKIIIKGNQTKQFTLQEIEYVTEKENCSFYVVSKQEVISFKYDSSQEDSWQSLYQAIGYSAKNGITRKVKSFQLAYVMGDASFDRGSNITFEIYDRFILCTSVSVKKGIKRFALLYPLIESVSLKTLDEIREQQDHKPFMLGSLSAWIKQKPKRQQNLLTLMYDGIFMAFTCQNPEEVLAWIPQPQEVSSDRFEEMKKYKDMFDLGILSSEEYEKKRRELMQL